MKHRDCLTLFLRDQDAAVATFSPDDWSMLFREAQRSNLLSRVAILLGEENLPVNLPSKLLRRLEGAARVAAASARSVRWEVRKLQEALSPKSIPFVLLKGAAYELAGLPPAPGRLYVDVDIMVPRERLEEAERALFDHGWHGAKMDAYDQRYYRTWMHEIPPMRNLKRNTSLDVHHTILPPTAKLKPDVALLWQGATELPQWPGVWVLSPADMLLHSAVHLFHDGDLDGGFRDLVDLDALLRHFGRDADFWPLLMERARALDLSRPLHYALRYTSAFLGTPLPERGEAGAAAIDSPGWAARAVMDKLVHSALDPSRENLDSRRAGFYRWLLYVRSHYLRMPPRLLVPHLLRKAFYSEV